MNVKTIIYGTSLAAQNVTKCLADEFEIVAVVDSDVQKSGLMFNQFTILHSFEIPKLDYDLVLICSHYHQEIKITLQSLQVPADKIMTATIAMRKGLHHAPEILHFQSKVNYIPRYTRAEERYLNLCTAVEYTYIAGVEGDIAEFGCGSGVSTHALASSILQCEKEYEKRIRRSCSLSKSLHLFDSFEGLPCADSDIDKNTPDVVNQAWSEGKCFDFDAGALKFALYRQLKFNSAQFYIGWYENTLSSIPTSTLFSLVHLDCDLYQSTIDVLSYLIDNKHLSEGSLLCFDDWTANKASPRLGQRKAWADIIDKYDITWSDFGFYANGCKKIIIHEY